MEINTMLKQMTTEQKISTMEVLWDELCRKADSILSPPWHKDILLEREAQVKEDGAVFVDWEQAKKDIRENVL